MEGARGHGRLSATRGALSQVEHHMESRCAEKLEMEKKIMGAGMPCAQLKGLGEVHSGESQSEPGWIQVGKEISVELTLLVSFAQPVWTSCKS